MFRGSCKYFLKSLPKYGSPCNRIHLGEANVIGTAIDSSSIEYQVNINFILSHFFFFFSV